ncbi:glycoside hydrolase family 31 protein [Salipaludibacillus agaradhaerens]|uniref:glycoside hydrolase family 31 protein n=1 Tax=Salipaludibacillus agaradhaerens TaxID=76935 RepID=UPI0021519A27
MDKTIVTTDKAVVNKQDHIVSIHLKEVNKTLQIMVLEDTVFRVLMTTGDELTTPETWMIAPGLEDVPFEGRDRLDVSPFRLPDYSACQDGDELALETEKLKVVIRLSELKLTWFEKKHDNWVQVAADRDTVSYNHKGDLGDGVYHYMSRSSSDRYYGLGEKTGDLNRYGRRYRMKNFDPMGYDPKETDPLYKHIPFYMVKNGSAYGILYDNLSTSTFDMGNEMDNYHGYYRYYHAEGGDLDYYFISGTSLRDVLKQYVWLTGKAIMGPKWSLGYSGSTMTYTDADDAQDQLYQFIHDCQTYDIPCDSFQLSSGYTSIGDKRYVFNWNRDKFPDPKKLFQDFVDAGVRLCANIKPAMLIDHPLYEEGKEKDLFIKQAKEDEPELIQFWDERGSYLDFTNPATIDWWKTKVKEQLLSYGISSTWNDNNEYEIWDNRARIHGFGQERSIREYRPVMTLLMMKASLEAQKEFTSRERPYLISRSGCPGMQRYAQTWTGDNRTSWETLKYNIRTGVGLSLSGIYNFGHDVGGFAGDAPEPELFVRWIQNGIFHPRFTIHSWNDDKTVNVPWMYKEYLSDVSGLMTFRARLIPYIYDLLHQASENNEPMVKPLFFNYEDDEEAYKESDEFLLGDDVLVVTATEKDMTQKSVYLPEGTSWIYYLTGKSYRGGSYVNVELPMDKPLFFMKEGSILPLAVLAHDGGFGAEEVDREFTINLTNGHTSFERRFYDDDGLTQKYQDGDYCYILIKVEETPETVNLHYTVDGQYTPALQKLHFTFNNRNGRQVFINGQEAEEADTIKRDLE